MSGMSEHDDDPIEVPVRQFTTPAHPYHEVAPPPAVGYVVHTVAGRKTGSAIVWAWCRVEEGQPGYTSVTFTTDDGVTPADPYPGEPDHVLHLGPVVTKVWC